jgi:hypothetical protein
MQEASGECNAEEWRPVVGYEDWYEVSTQGRVRRSVDGLRRGIKAGYVLQPRPTDQGYPFVGLYSRDKKVSRSTLVHNVVTAAFLGPKPPDMQVNHIDGNKLNARLGNLEYVTGSDNQRHAYCLGLMKKKLNPSLVREIRLYEGKHSSAATGAVFGLSATTVQYVWRRVYWSTVEDYDPVDFLNF